jgi:hypothetical protein
MPFLRAHRRRVPTQDVDRRILIGMRFVAAIDTPEDRLAFVAPGVDAAAFRVCDAKAGLIITSAAPRSSIL